MSNAERPEAGRRAVRPFAAVLAAVVLAGGAAAMVTPASAQIDSYQDVVNIRNATPKCRDHPDAPIIGRVAGNTEGMLDQSLPVSFVGCFPDMATCTAWKERASAIVTTTLTQYSCKPRR